MGRLYDLQMVGGAGPITPTNMGGLGNSHLATDWATPLAESKAALDRGADGVILRAAMGHYARKVDVGPGVDGKCLAEVGTERDAVVADAAMVRMADTFVDAWSPITAAGKEVIAFVGSPPWELNRRTGLQIVAACYARIIAAGCSLCLDSMMGLIYSPAHPAMKVADFLAKNRDNLGPMPMQRFGGEAIERMRQASWLAPVNFVCTEAKCAPSEWGLEGQDRHEAADSDRMRNCYLHPDEWMILRDLKAAGVESIVMIPIDDIGRRMRAAREYAARGHSIAPYTWGLSDSQMDELRAACSSNA